MPSAMPGTATAARTLVKSEPGPDHDLVGRAPGRPGPRAAPAGRSGTSETRWMWAVRHDRGLALDLPRVGLGLEHDRLVAAGTTRPTAPRSRAASSRPVWRSPRAAISPAMTRLPEGVAGELVGSSKRCSKACGQDRALLGQGHQALAQVAGGHDAELAAQPPRRAAVVGHRHDGGELARRRAGPPAGWPPARGRPPRPPPGVRPARRSPVDVPVEDRRGGRPWPASRRAELLGQDHRAVAAAGAAHGDGQVRLALVDDRRAGACRRGRPPGRGRRAVASWRQDEVADRARRGPTAGAGPRPSGDWAGSGSRRRGRRRGGRRACSRRTPPRSACPCPTRRRRGRGPAGAAG